MYKYNSVQAFKIKLNSRNLKMRQSWNVQQTNLSHLLNEVLTRQWEKRAGLNQLSNCVKIKINNYNNNIIKRLILLWLLRQMHNVYNYIMFVVEHCVCGRSYYNIWLNIRNIKHWSLLEIHVTGHIFSFDCYKLKC